MADTVLATMRRVSMPPLPYDAEVEYLEATGKYGGNAWNSVPYIDTGIKQNIIDRYVFDVELFGIQKRFIGANVFDSGANCFCVATPNNGYAHFPYCYGVSISPWSGWVDNTITTLRKPYPCRYLFDISVRDGLQTMKIDGLLHKQSFKTGNLDSRYSISLFRACGMSDQIHSRGTARFYSCIFMSNSEVILDAVSVRFTNENGVTEGALYDRRGVGGMNRDGTPRNDGMYLNQGTGAFIVGPDKQTITANLGVLAPLKEEA